VFARVLLAEHDPAPALALLQRWRELALAEGRAASVLRFGCWKHSPMNRPVTRPPR
jgi:hypothetical protein